MLRPTAVWASVNAPNSKCAKALNRYARAELLLSLVMASDLSTSSSARSGSDSFRNALARMSYTSHSLGNISGRRS